MDAFKTYIAASILNYIKTILIGFIASIEASMWFFPQDAQGNIGGNALYSIRPADRKGGGIVIAQPRLWKLVDLVSDENALW